MWHVLALSGRRNGTRIAFCIPGQGVRKPMVRIPVRFFVRADLNHNISQPCVCRHVPIRDRDFRGRNIFEMPRIDLFQIVVIAADRFFFQIPNETVRRFWEDQIEEEIEIIEDRLNDHNDKALKHGWLGHLNERHQVHPFVFRLVQQFPNPALIVADVT